MRKCQEVGLISRHLVLGTGTVMTLLTVFCLNLAVSLGRASGLVGFLLGRRLRCHQCGIHKHSRSVKQERQRKRSAWSPPLPHSHAYAQKSSGS